MLTHSTPWTSILVIRQLRLRTVDKYTRHQATAPQDCGQVYSSSGNCASGPWTSILVIRQLRLRTVDKYTRHQAIAPRDRGQLYSSSGNCASGPWTSILVQHRCLHFVASQSVQSLVWFALSTHPFPLMTKHFRHVLRWTFFVFLRS